jgi:molecular chaperone DnaJ
MYDLGGAVRPPVARGPAQAPVQRHHGRFFGAGWPRGSRSTPRPQRHDQGSAYLAECVFGATRELTVDTAVVCPTCSGEGSAPGSHPTTCDICNGRGEVSQVTRSFLGQVMTSRPCPGCGGFGTVIRRPCPECDGDGRVRTRRTVKVRIPAGVEDGTHIQLAGEGEIGPGGGPPGDLFLEIVQRPHQIFERQGDDLHCTLTIPMTAAALGATLQIQTLDGAANIDIRPGTQSGQAIPLYGQGSSHLQGPGRGDLIIHVTVETPVKLEPEQKCCGAGQDAR